jgi:hypothetical protein
MGYNHYLWLNEYFYRNSFPWMSVNPRADQQFPVSSQSSFSTFRAADK